MGDIAYALSGETQIAYRVMGEAGRVDVVMVAGALFPFELLAEDRVASRFTAGLAALGRVLVFDKRGVGLSDPLTDWSRSVQEQWAEDLLAVIEAAALERPVLVSWEPNGVARLVASARPDLIASMVLVNPAGATRGLSELLSAKAGRALPNQTIEEIAFPSRIKDEAFTGTGILSWPIACVLRNFSKLGLETLRVCDQHRHLCSRNGDSRTKSQQHNASR